MFDALDMGASGLQAQRTRLDTIAENILNVNTTRNARGEKVPYRRRFAMLRAGHGRTIRRKPGVHVRGDPGRPVAVPEAVSSRATPTPTPTATC